MNRKLDELVHRSAAQAAGVTVIKRFSGGGTVAVDLDTIFTTLISSEAAVPEARACAVAIFAHSATPHLAVCLTPRALSHALSGGFAQLPARWSWCIVRGLNRRHDLLLQVEAYPRPLMQYTERLYRHAFGQYGNFRLRENGV